MNLTNVCRKWLGGALLLVAAGWPAYSPGQDFPKLWQAHSEADRARAERFDAQRQLGLATLEATAATEASQRAQEELDKAANVANPNPQQLEALKAAKEKLAAAARAVEQATAASNSALAAVRTKTVDEKQVTKHNQGVLEQAQQTAVDALGPTLAADEAVANARKTWKPQAEAAEKAAAARRAAQQRCDDAEARKAAAEKLVAEKTARAGEVAKAESAASSAAQATAGEELKAAQLALRQEEAEVKAAAEALAGSTQSAEKAIAARDAAQAVLDGATAKARQAWGVARAQAAAAVGGLKPLDVNAWDRVKARHLLVRAGFGGTAAEVDRLHAMGLSAAVDYVVDYQRRPYQGPSVDIFPPPRPEPLENKLPRDLRSKLQKERSLAENEQVRRLRQWWLQRMVESPHPLQEKLVLFWHSHFANQYSTVQQSYAMYQQNQLFREHANGNFAALLYGIVHDPSMLKYLDNNQNVKGKPNENLAREIMELFAMGVDQGYTETDIRQASRALTGYTFDQATGRFRFLHDNHDVSEKTIFGQTGPFTGDDLVKLILAQPETARFIAGKLFRYFAYDEPSAEVEARLARVLRGYEYELAPTLKALFSSEEFYSPQAMGTQIKCPVQLVVGALRDLGVASADYEVLDRAVSQMGQELLEPPDVKGWREGRAWINANQAFTRFNLLANVINSVPQSENERGADVVGMLPAAGGRSAAEVVDYLAAACLVRPLDAQKRQELVNYLGELPPPAEWASQRARLNQKLRTLLILMFGMPEFQMT